MEVKQKQEKGKMPAAPAPKVLPPAAKLEDEFGSDDEEAMVEACIQAEKEFTSSQPTPADTEAPSNSKPPPTEMETIDEKKEPVNKKDKQENKSEGKKSKNAETLASEEPQTEEGDGASGKAAAEAKE
jgi:hypothetical protein